MSRASIGMALGIGLLVACASSCTSGAPTGSGSTAGSGEPVVSTVPGAGTTATSAYASTASPAAAGPTPTGAPTLAAPSGPPAAGGCHVRGSGLYVLPDPACTPGATNPAVTQATIHQTICTSGWTATVRPPESYTEPLKYQQMAEYGDTNSAGNYEEDHLVPLELGGSPSSRQNLWPEPGASPNPKDSVESAANHAVCDGQMTLLAAQQAIAANWISFGRHLGVVPAQTPAGTPTPVQTPAPAQAPTPAAPSSQAATCSASASYSSKYGDWDVYVHSDQPNQTVTVTDSGGQTASYHTNNSGYADVYLHAPQTAAGQSVSVSVGRATCSTAL